MVAIGSHLTIIAGTRVPAAHSEEKPSLSFGDASLHVSVPSHGDLDDAPQEERCSKGSCCERHIGWPVVGRLYALSPFVSIVTISRASWQDLLGSGVSWFLRCILCRHLFHRTIIYCTVGAVVNLLVFWISSYFILRLWSIIAAGGKSPLEAVVATHPAIEHATASTLFRSDFALASMCIPTLETTSGPEAWRPSRRRRCSIIIGFPKCFCSCLISNGRITTGPF